MPLKSILEIKKERRRSKREKESREDIDRKRKKWSHTEKRTEGRQRDERAKIFLQIPKNED